MGGEFADKQTFPRSRAGRDLPQAPRREPGLGNVGPGWIWDIGPASVAMNEETLDRSCGARRYRALGYSGLHPAFAGYCSRCVPRRGRSLAQWGVHRTATWRLTFADHATAGRGRLKRLRWIEARLEAPPGSGLLRRLFGVARGRSRTACLCPSTRPVRTPRA